MKLKYLAALASATLLLTGCVKTVSGGHALALSITPDMVEGRYQRSVDQVYQAAVTVIQNNGVLLNEYIPHDTTNTVRALEGTVNQRHVWVRVEAVDPRITQVDVQARSKWGFSDVELVHQLEKDIALQLAR